jgi:hypothetical protein
MGRTKEIKLKRFTTAAAVLFFVVAMAVSIVGVHFPDGLGTGAGSGDDGIIDDTIGDDDDIIGDDDDDTIGDDDDDTIGDDDDTIGDDDGGTE